MNLTDSIQFIKGVGPKTAKRLEKKGVSTVEDALYFLPRAYEDRRVITPISQLKPGQWATVFGTIKRVKVEKFGRKSRFKAILFDNSGDLELCWFHVYPSLNSEFVPEARFLAYGKVDFFSAMPQMTHPDYEKVDECTNGKPKVSANFGRIVPVYSETEGLHQKSIRRIMVEVVKNAMPNIQESLPESILKQLALPSLRESIVGLHFPRQMAPDSQLNAVASEISLLTPELKRLIFEEFFVLQLGLGINRNKAKNIAAPPLVDSKNLVQSFLRKLPFQITNDQKDAISEIQNDLLKPHPMMRLIQGDVGCGKTVVALASAAIAKSSGYQTAFLAPTEILAEQHFEAAKRWLLEVGISVQLVTSANPAKAIVCSDIVIGTHALFQEHMRFSALGLVIVDEQHRFGVEQRAALLKKSATLSPHLLMMTATPIPRTLSLTVYGDLDLTIIQQKPPGRKAVKTTVLLEKQRPRLYQTIRQVVRAGHQVYIIYPLIEASEKLELKSASEMYEKLRHEIFPEFSMALLHGKMPSENKEHILSDFKSAKYQILVSTTVIEVGIDVPNATLMVIEHAERLGLSQLHQLRGRVGRGETNSECILMTERFVTERIRVMEQTDDGFEIAEQDLRIRGPGEFLGTKQSGLPGFRVGHLLRDAKLLQVAKLEADKILKEDPDLIKPQHEKLQAMVQTLWKEKIARLAGG